MSQHIEAIETIHNGYRFRSRLEARWAVFMDSLSLEYEYEKEGYDLDKLGWYLPDFWLPGLNCWLEIKPTLPTPQAQEKCASLAVASGKNVYMSCDSIPSREQVLDGGAPILLGYEWSIFMGNAFAARTINAWCVCPICRKPLIARHGFGAQSPILGYCHCDTHLYRHEQTYDASEILDAYAVARRYRPLDQ